MKEGTPNIGAVCQRLAKHAPSGLSAEQIAYRLGRPYNTLMSELSPLRDTHKFDVNLLIPLMRLAGSTEPLHEMARALGGVYVDFLPVSDVAHPVHGQCMASVKSFGDMMVGTAKALEDNIITSEERRELARLGYRAVGDILALLLQIDPSIRIEAVIETVVETVRWVKDNPLPDLIFMDIPKFPTIFCIPTVII